jgi:hypothetical protein
MEGWFDIIYPHFMTHVGISEVARCVLEADGSSQSSSVVLVDGADHVICKLSLGTDNKTSAQEAWADLINGIAK